MTLALEGRSVIITGGGRGLGRGMAVAAAQAGADVTVVARSVDQLRGTVAEIEAAGGRAWAESVDVADSSAVRDLAERVHAARPIWGVVHAAGVQSRHDAIDFPEDEFERVLRINLTAPFVLGTAIAKLQIRDGLQGSHVMVGSLGTSIGLPRVAAYVASKSGIHGLARTLAREWAEHGIRVNVIGPGYFLTDLTKDLLVDPANEARVMSRIPMGRLGTADDLGGATVFLLSDASNYVTGQLINVDGGWLAS
jgi:2-deoxy-D-gluconate 3-dehydrogenase